MNETTTFCYTRIKGSERDWQPLLDRVNAESDPDVGIWGAWSGVFGIGSNELVVMTTSDRGDHGARFTASVAKASGVIVEQHLLTATARPTDTRQLTRPGLYVFRFFDVRNADVDEIVALSTQAWTTFESSGSYQSQPQGLFCPSDRRSTRGVMLLCTWYDGLESWQTSRAPPPEAAANFRRRHLLTQGTIAYATRLIENGVGRR